MLKTLANSSKNLKLNFFLLFYMKEEINDFIDDLKQKYLIQNHLGQNKSKNEKDYQEGIKEINKKLWKINENIKKEDHYLYSEKRIFSNQINNLNKELENKDSLVNDIKGNIAKLMAEIEKVKISTNYEINELLKEKEILESKGREQEELIMNKEKAIAKLQDKKQKQFNELFEISLKVSEFQKNSEERQQQNTCCVCLNEKATFACAPCGHKKYCEVCIKNIKKCAICKQYIQEKIRVYDD